MKKTSLNIINKLSSIVINTKIDNNNNNIKLPDNEFMTKYVWIINKKKERQLLTLNKTQQAIENKINELISKGIPPRIIILKARQEGVTTYFQGKMISNSTQNKDRNSLIVSHEQDSTSAIFAKTKFMYDNLPDTIRPLQKASNARELIFDKPTHYKGDKDGLNSKVVVKIAGKESIGRSDTYSYVHLSEYAFWKGSGENSPENQLNAIMQAVPESINTIVIIESTAKGYNDFKNVWDKAVSGENGWTPLFFPWFYMDEYSREFNNENDKQLFLNTMDDYEKDIKDRFNLTLEKVNWYRYTKKVKCNNNHDKMKQENPSFPEEAFLFSGRPCFNNNLIMNRINDLVAKYKSNPPRQGLFSFNESTKEYKFIDSHNIEIEGEKVSEIIIYEEPQYGYPYAIGADTSGDGKDYYTATVINNNTGNRVATLRIQCISSKAFTHQLYCLGMYYNKAMIAVEINFNTAPVEYLSDLNYPVQYFRKKYDEATFKIQDKIGWKTDGTTRQNIIDKEITFVSENINCFSDINTLREMLTFVHGEKRADAISGKHDDLIFSDMIGEEIRHTYRKEIRERQPEKQKKLIDELTKGKRRR